MQDIYARVSYWNKKRFAREHDAEMLYRLLKNETTEWLEVKSRLLCSTDSVKELCDIIYVCMGGLWKLHVNMENPSEETQSYVLKAEQYVDYLRLYAITSNEPYVDYVSTCYNNGTDFNILDNTAEFLLALIACCAAQLTDMQISRQNMHTCLLAVCDSNDTKELDTSKGPNFALAELAIQKILTKGNNFETTN